MRSQWPELICQWRVNRLSAPGRGCFDRLRLLDHVDTVSSFFFSDTHISSISLYFMGTNSFYVSTFERKTTKYQGRPVEKTHLANVTAPSPVTGYFISAIGGPSKCAHMCINKENADVTYGCQHSTADAQSHFTSIRISIRRIGGRCSFPRHGKLLSLVIGT